MAGGTSPTRTCPKSISGRALALAAAAGLSLSLLPVRLDAATSAHRKQLARQQFARAEQARGQLNAKPEEERRPADYLAAVRAYEEVVRLAPTVRQAPESLFRAAELCRQLAERLGENKAAANYRGMAREKYEFLLKEYPENRFLAESKKALAEIAEAVRREPAAEAAQAGESKPRPASDKLVQVTNIRQWSTPNYTRLVIDLDEEVQYEASRISNPDRIFFDLHHTHLTPSLARRNLNPEDGLVKRVRLAQNRSNVTRVVLELDQIGNYSAFLLPNPYRLVIDVHGARKPASAKSKAPAQPEAAPATSETRDQPAPPSAALASRRAPETPPESKPTAAETTKRAAGRAPETPAETPPAKAESTEAQEQAAAGSAVSATRGPTSKPVYDSVRPAKPTTGGQRTLTRALGLKIGRVVVDPGHGGHDTGTIGPTGLTEKDLVMDVARRLGALLEERLGCEVVYTREDDTFIPLESRTAMANQKQADLFVSVHANSSRDSRARGIETYYLNFTTAQDALEVAARENAVSEKSVHELQDLVKKITLREKVDESREFAAEVQKSLYGGMVRGNIGLRNRGVRKAPFIVLIGANMPSILAEISFVSNPQDERLLRKGEYRQRVAESMFRGIQRYAASLGGVKVASRTPTPSAN